MKRLAIITIALLLQLKIPTEVDAKPLTDEIIQRSCMVELLYYEGRNTGYEGMRKIAYVVHNRTNHPKRFGKDYCSTSLERKQFSFHQDKHKQKKPSEKDNTAFRLACIISEQVQKGYIVPTDVEKKIMYYHTKSVKPTWRNKLTVVYSDKWHVFYK